MSLEFVNRICPNCKSPNYMILLGDFSKAYKYKCMNCNGYFNDIDFEKEPLQPVRKSEFGMSDIKEEEVSVPVQKREMYHLSFFACGSCGTVITDGDRFCRMCGKKVKWE